MYFCVFEVICCIQVCSVVICQCYFEMVWVVVSKGLYCGILLCGNFVYGVVVCGESDKQILWLMNQVNVVIVFVYNDMFLVYQLFECFLGLIKQVLYEIGLVGQFVGGVLVMCDGVIQGELGMELLLVSCDVIVMFIVIVLFYNMFDVVLCLGVCDKIVLGLLIGLLCFGYLFIVFVLVGLMLIGIFNKEKVVVC